jgi:hypothetical protein
MDRFLGREDGKFAAEVRVEWKENGSIPLGQIFPPVFEVRPL